MIIDFDDLRHDLINYFGAATLTGFPSAYVDIENVKTADDKELLKTAIDNGFDLKSYRVVEDWPIKSCRVPTLQLFYFKISNYICL